MIDTGAAVNIIKQRCINARTPINTRDTISLSGITREQVETLGSIVINAHAHPVTLYVVPDNFAIPQEGILGTEFLQYSDGINLKEKFVNWHGIEIPFTDREVIVAPARSRSTFCVKVANPDVKIGYVPRLRAREGVYIGDAVVTNRNGKAYLGVTNTTDTDHALLVPTVELTEIEFMRKEPCDFSEEDNPNSNSEHSSYCEPLGLRDSSTDSRKTNIQPHKGKKRAKIATVTTKSQDPRFFALLNNLRLDHLNTEEQGHVKGLINENLDLFRLPDEPLGHTHTIAHRITTTDDKPINTKQYRFPPVHKDEISKQVSDLIKNDIISPSESPYNSPLWIVPKNAETCLLI